MAIISKKGLVNWVKAIISKKGLVNWVKAQS